MAKMQFKLFEKNFSKYGFNRTCTQFHNKQFHQEFLILPMRSRKSSTILHPKESCISKKAEDFINDIDDLFDAFNQNEQHRKKLEKRYKLRVNESAWNFYHDQRGPRIGNYYKNILNLI